MFPFFYLANVSFYKVVGVFIQAVFALYRFSVSTEKVFKAQRRGGCSSVGGVF